MNPERRKDLAIKIGALLFYQTRSQKEKIVLFEDLSLEERLPFETQAEKVLIATEKLNFMVVPLVTDSQNDEMVRTRTDRIVGVIDHFFEGLKVFKRDAIDCRELAMRIEKEIQ
ncbi:hypothetical protein L0152_32110 [bacterium]|nr:hypothetical protein [bacterium]